MYLISDSELLEYNRIGWVPGPHEDEERFLKRIQSLQQQPLAANEMRHYCPIPQEQKGPALERVKNIFGVCPDWVEMFYSNQKLAPWHGGAAEMLLEENGELSGAYLQLRRAFQQQRSLLSRLYSRDEILTHELAHIGRMAFDEPCFEEFFACLTSTKRWRFWLGPLLTATWEVILFFIVMLMSIVMMQPLLLVTMLGLFAARLIYRHRVFRHAYKHLIDVVGDRRLAMAVMYRFTDEEIRLFAQLNASEIKVFIHSHKAKTLRWRSIALLANL
jgi:hypothetical protein